MSADDEHIIQTEKRKSVLWRQFPKYRNNTNTGFFSAAGIWEAHHVLCYDSVESREISENEDYVEACLWITDWNLNDSLNMIGLPKNRQYKQTSGTTPSNLPSHQVDHNTKNGYRDEVTMWLKDNIWDTLNDKRKAHEINAKSIENVLKSASDKFRELIESRGQRKKGTLYCWQHRLPTPPPALPASAQSSYKQEKKWYFPFSMAKKPNERHPGVDHANLTYIFKKI